MIMPLALYLARCAMRSAAGSLCADPAPPAAPRPSRGPAILMFVVVLVVFLWLRPRRDTAAVARLDPRADRDQASRSPAPWARSSSRSSRRVASWPSRVGRPARAAAGGLPTSARGSTNGERSRSSARGSARASSSRPLDLERRHPGRSVARDAARDRHPSASFGWLWFFARASGDSARRRNGTTRRARLAAGRAHRVGGGVRRRHAHLRRVLVHPGDVPALHPRRARLGRWSPNVAPVTLLARARRRREPGALPAGDAPGA